MAELFYRKPLDGSLEEKSISSTQTVTASPRNNTGFALKCTSGDAVYILPLPNGEDDMINGSAWRGANGAPCGLLSALASATATVTVATPLTTTFVKNAPVLIATTPDVADGIVSGNAEWRLVTTVTYTSTSTTRSWTLTLSSALINSYKKNAVAYQPEIGKTRLSSLGIGRDGTRQNGLRIQLEAQDAPTVTGVTATSATVTVSVAVPESNRKFGQYAKVYAFDSYTDAMRGIAPTRRHDGTVTFGIATSGNCTITTHGGGADYGGGTLASATKYWFRAVLVDTLNDWPEIIGKASDPTGWDTI